MGQAVGENKTIVGNFTKCDCFSLCSNREDTRIFMVTLINHTACIGGKTQMTCNLDMERESLNTSFTIHFSLAGFDAHNNERRFRIGGCRPRVDGRKEGRTKKAAFADVSCANCRGWNTSQIWGISRSL